MMTNEDGKRWLIKTVLINLITLIVLAGIFYGTTITKDAHQDQQIERLDCKKANKDLVGYQFEVIMQTLGEIKQDVKNLESE